MLFARGRYLHHRNRGTASRQEVLEHGARRIGAPMRACLMKTTTTALSVRVSVQHRRACCDMLLCCCPSPTFFVLDDPDYLSHLAVPNVSQPVPCYRCYHIPSSTTPSENNKTLPCVFAVVPVPNPVTSSLPAASSIRSAPLGVPGGGQSLSPPEHP